MPQRVHDAESQMTAKPPRGTCVFTSGARRHFRFWLRFEQIFHPEFPVIHGHQLSVDKQNSNAGHRLSWENSFSSHISPIPRTSADLHTLSLESITNHWESGSSEAERVRMVFDHELSSSLHRRHRNLLEQIKNCLIKGLLHPAI